MNAGSVKIDYLIIGQGLSGSCFARLCEKHNKSFLVLDEEEENASSRVAGGLINPVTGQRVVKTWLADEIFPYAEDFYLEMENLLGQTFLVKKGIYKPYQDIAEQNDVLAKGSQDSISKYLDFDVDTKKYEGFIKQDSGAVLIKGGGYLKCKEFVNAYKAYLISQKKYLKDHFEESNLVKREGVWVYKNIEAQNVVLAQGHQATQNKFFNWLPFSLTKGQILEVDIPNLPDDDVLNKGCFIFKLDNGDFVCGSSYEREINKEITELGKNMVLEKLNNLVKVPYTIKNQRVGIRPTVLDRKPFLGEHPTLKKLYIFNGLGAKGVTLGPYFAENLFNFIEQGLPLEATVSITRYYSNFEKIFKK